MHTLAIQPIGFPERFRRVIEVVISQAFAVDWYLRTWQEDEADGVDVLIQLVGDRWPVGDPVPRPPHAPKCTVSLHVSDTDHFRDAPYSIARNVLFSQLVPAVIAVADSAWHGKAQRRISPDAAKTEQSPPESNARVAIIVDTNKQARIQVSAELAAMGFKPQAFGDAKQALAFASANPVSLAVLETELPDMDGITLSRKLREHKGEPISILMLTSHGGAMERLRAMVSGSQAFLVKPVDRLLFRNEIHRLLAHHDLGMLGH